LASAAFLRGRGRVVSVPAPESGRVARRGGRRARRGARSPNRRKPFPARVAVFSRRSRKSGPDGAAAHARKRPGRFRFEALERVDRETRTRGRRGRRSFARRGPRGIRTAAHRTLGIFSNSCAGVRTESISPNGFVPVIQARLTGARARDRVGTSAERPRVRPRLTLEAADREARVLTRA
jgi:hypothetical protein